MAEEAITTHVWRCLRKLALRWGLRVTQCTKFTIASPSTPMQSPKRKAEEMENKRSSRRKLDRGDNAGDKGLSTPSKRQPLYKLVPAEQPARISEPSSTGVKLVEQDEASDRQSHLCHCLRRHLQSRASSRSLKHSLHGHKLVLLPRIEVM